MTPEAAKLLADPLHSLPAFAHVVDQETGDVSRYDPFRLTNRLQASILTYISEPPRTETGHTRWLVVLKPRQGGSSTTCGLGFYPLAAYNEGWRHVTYADKRDRADDLFRSIMFAHQRWPSRIRVEQFSTQEVRQLSFKNGSVMKVDTGQGEAAGIGQSVSSFHGSELPFWPSAARQFSLIYPSMMNKLNSLMVLESTPATLDYPSAEWWKNQCQDAAKGRGRLAYLFVPFWDVRLCARPWPQNAHVDLEELRLLEKYGPLGLTVENLAFRRSVLETDAEIRRNHDLFRVFYPFDDQSCWVSASRSVIPAHLIERHLMPNAPLLPDGYNEFRGPEPDGIYVIGADPAGYGVRDHCAFQVLRVWADEWEQVASFGDVRDPEEFAKLLHDTGIRYNRARIAVERNGVGVATLAMLRQMRYPNLHYDAKGKPGIHKSSSQEFTALLCDALGDVLTLRDKDTVGQIMGYQSDHDVQKTARAELLSAGRGDGARRKRHHWDKVSALMIACATAPFLPKRYKPVVELNNVVPFKQLTWDQLTEYDKRVASHTNSAKGKRRATYTRRRK